MRGWHRRGSRVVGVFDRQEAALLRGLVTQIRDILRARFCEAPQDELTELTGIRTGPSTPPEDPILRRLLPDYHRMDDPQIAMDAERYADSAAGLRSLHEPELVELKSGVAGVLLDTLPPSGGKVSIDAEQANAWLCALNDVRLALGTALGVTEDLPEQLPDDDPRAPHLGVYHWLTWVQESLIQAASR
ncbi:MAG: DUF2017 domain-containing protein [Sciscionella sp.]